MGDLTNHLAGNLQDIFLGGMVNCEQVGQS